MDGDHDRIMYINESGYFTTQIGERQYNQEEFDKYYEKIFRNNSAYEYYKDSYELTNWVRNNLAGLVVSNNDAEYDGYTLTDVGNIFDETIPIQDSNSNFNMHRADVIRATIETNLKTAISGFSKYSNTDEGFIMPKISESDWELLENNVCMATFFQGIRIAGKLYNNYDVSVASVNKEYVDENDIYILMDDYTYTVPNDATLDDTKIKKVDGPTGLRYQPGVLKVNVESRKDSEETYFNPLSVDSTTPYLRSYTGMPGTGNVNAILRTDMYRYMRGITENEVKKAYYTALARERQGAYKHIDSTTE